MPITPARTTTHTKTFQLRRNLILMNDFYILNNRKRALIAMLHSLVFLGIALHGFAAPKVGIVTTGFTPAGDVVLIAVYLAVASILLWLVILSRCLRERLYFLLCAGSATSGLLRTVFGDATLPEAQYLRVVLLTSAVVVGTTILRLFSRLVPEDALSD